MLESTHFALVLVFSFLLLFMSVFAAMAICAPLGLFHPLSFLPLARLQCCDRRSFRSSQSASSVFRDRRASTAETAEQGGAPGSIGLGREATIARVIVSRKDAVVGHSQQENEGGARKEDGNKRIFIFGMGYTCLALANCLKKENWTVSGTCRSDEKRASLEQRGIQTFSFNPDNDGENLKEEAIGELFAATHVLSSVPPVGDFDKDPVLASHRADLVHAAGRGKLQWIGYLSSTGVYGDWKGNWVDEDTEPHPDADKARTRLAAEKGWLELGEQVGVAVHIFRLGGIYGPGRSALDTVRSQHKLSARQQFREQRRYISRVHVADICQVLVKAMVFSNFTRIYNVVDDDPASRSEVMAFARKLLCGDNIIVNESPETNFLSSRPTVTKVSEKRVSNKLVKDELHVELFYPTFRSGLQAIADGLNNPFS